MGSSRTSGDAAQSMGTLPATDPTPPGWWQQAQAQQPLRTFRDQQLQPNTPSWQQLQALFRQRYQPQPSRFNNLQAPMGVPALAQPEPEQPYQPFEINA